MCLVPEGTLGGTAADYIVSDRHDRWSESEGVLVLYIGDTTGFSVEMSADGGVLCRVVVRPVIAQTMLEGRCLMIGVHCVCGGAALSPVR